MINARCDYLVTQTCFNVILALINVYLDIVIMNLCELTSVDVAVFSILAAILEILEKAPVGITGSFIMFFLMVFGRFPKKFSFGL